MKIEQIQIHNYIKNYPHNDLGIYLLFCFLNSNIKSKIRNNINNISSENDIQNPIVKAFYKFEHNKEFNLPVEFVNQYSFQDNCEKIASLLSQKLNKVIIYIEAKQEDTLLPLFEPLNASKGAFPVVILKTDFLISEGKLVNDTLKNMFVVFDFRIAGVVVYLSQEKYIFIMNKYNHYFYSLTENKWVSSIRHHLLQKNKITKVILIYFNQQTVKKNRSVSFPYTQSFEQDKNKINFSQKMMDWYLKNQKDVLQQHSELFFGLYGNDEKDDQKELNFENDIFTDISFYNCNNQSDVN